MGNLITSFVEVVAPFVKKPRLAVMLLVTAISIQPNVLQAVTVTDDVATTVAVVEDADPQDTKGVDTEEVKIPETIQDVLLEVCTERGYGTDCAKHLLGMAWTESNFKAGAKGDYVGSFPRARGWFQIHYKLHRISVECAEDLRCSADWTITYLEGNQYPKYVNYAIQCHNGCNANNGYVNKVLRSAQRYWGNTEITTLALVK